MNYSADKKRATFGQRVLGYTTRRSESMGGGGGGGGGLTLRWKCRWAPPVNTTTKIRILPGSYLDLEGDEGEYFPFVEHFVKRSNRGFICSKQYQIVNGDLATIGGKCLGCQEIDNGAEDISWRMLHAFNVLHLSWYHYVPAVDDKGRPIKYSKGKKQGEQAMNELPCEGRKCPHCADKHEKFFGRHVYWSLGSGHMNEFAGVVEEIGKDCANCGEGRLNTASYECEKCGHVYIDMETTELDQKAVRSFVARKHECPKCQHVGTPLKQDECDNCRDPLSLSIFDCELEIKRQGEGTNSTIQIPRWVKAEIPKELEEKCKPFNFKKVFTPDPFEIQAKILKIKNPWGKEDAKADDHAKDHEDEADYE